VQALIAAQDGEALAELLEVMTPPLPAEHRSLTVDGASEAGGDLVYV
jgi:hypothetical protein